MWNCDTEVSFIECVKMEENMLDEKCQRSEINEGSYRAFN